MFVRISPVKVGEKYYEYLRIVETYREKGKVKQRVIANLGQVNLIRGQLDGVVKTLRKYCRETFVIPSEIQADSTALWGPVLVARHLWQQLGLDEIVRRHCQKHQTWDVAETILALVTYRWCTPGSEHGIARWLETYFVCDQKGRRCMPQWREEKEITKEQRVRIQDRQLNIWYRSLDALIRAKETIEQELYLTLRNLFHIEVDLVFYDITSMYFEGRGPAGLAKHGYSRDGKRRNPQVVVGVVMVNGWAIAHHVFPGNTTDKSTLQRVIDDIQKRFSIRQVIIVTDRGMVSEANLDFLNENKYRYIVGIQRRRNPEVLEFIERIDEQLWQDCGQETFVQEVPTNKEGIRCFVVKSAERKEYEETMRTRSMSRARENLEAIAAAVAQGRLKKTDKIIARAERVLQKNKAYRYFSYEASRERTFRFWEDETKLAKEKAYEGTYILKTNDPHLKTAAVVEAYKELSRVEQSFRYLKDIIEVRPIYHRKESRVKAHIFVATLALVLMRSLQEQLQEKGVYLSGPEALKALDTIGIAELKFGAQTHRIVSSGGRDARRVIKALGIKHIQPPGKTNTE